MTPAERALAVLTPWLGRGVGAALQSRLTDPVAAAIEAAVAAERERIAALADSDAVDCFKQGSAHKGLPGGAALDGASIALQKFAAQLRGGR